MKMQNKLSKICGILMLCLCSVGLLQAQVERTVYQTCASQLPFVIGDSSFTESGDYDVVFSADSVLHLTLVVHQNPTPLITGQTARCPGSFTTLCVQQTYSQYSWSNGYTTSCSRVWDNLVSVQVVDSHGCTGSTSVNITERPLPDVRILGAQHLCYGESATLQVFGLPVCDWNYDNIVINEQSSITYTPVRNDNYTTAVKIIGYSDIGCVVKDTFYIRNSARDTTHLNVGVCRNEYPYRMGPYSIDSAGVYEFHFTSSHGCDSIVRLTVQTKEIPYATISGNTSFCPGGSTQLYASGGGTYEWSTGATYSPVTINSAGTVTLTVTATNGCKSRDTVDVTVLPLPDIRIEGPTESCAGSQVVLTASGADSYSWNVGTTGSNLTVYPTQSTTYIVTGTSQCVATATHVVWVHNLPTPSISGNNSICPGETSTFTASGGTTYLWSTGETSPTITVSTPQLYSVVVANSFGCTAIAQRELVVNELPTVNIIGDSTICEGESTTLVATGTHVSSYRWNDGTVGMSKTVSVADIYSVTATSPAGCMASASITVSVASLPVIQVSGERSFCDGQSTTLKASGANSYVWKNAYGITISTSDSVVLIAGGAYSVTASNIEGCSTSQLEIVNSKNLPNAAIVADKSEICTGDSLTLVAGWAVGYQYLWNTGATTRQIVVKNGDTYSVMVTANGCSALASMDVTEHALPSISFSGNTNICYGDSTTITAAAADAVRYQWSNGRETSSITVQPVVDTQYQVKVTDVHSCANTSSVNVNVADLPVVVISGLDSMCVGDSILLTSTGGVVCFWNDEVITPNRYVYQQGTYTVIHTNIWGCTSSASKTVWYYEMPTASITGTSWFCTGNFTTLTAHGGERYKWSSGSTDSVLVVTSEGVYGVQLWDRHSCVAADSVDVTRRVNPVVLINGQTAVCSGDTSLLTASAPTAIAYQWSTGSQDSVIRVSEAGIYSVVVEDHFACHGQSSVDFKVHDLPACSVVGDSVICAGDTAQLTAEGGISYLWSTGDTTMTIRVSPDSTSTFLLTVADSNGCVNYSSFTVTVKQISPIFIEGPDGFCIGDSALLIAHGAENYQWSTGKISDRIYVNQPGLYEVYSQETNGCMTSASKYVNQYEIPEVSVGGAEQGCNGDTVELKAVSNVPVTYLWSNGSTDSTARVYSTNVYRVTVTDENGCHNSAAKLLMFYTMPSVEIVAPTSVCRGDSVTLTSITENNVSYLWSTGQTTSSIVVSPNSYTNYTVIVANEHGCTSSASTSLLVNPKPYVSIMGDTAICEGGTTNLVATTALSYRWSTGSTNQTILVSQAGDYSVTITNGLGCTNNASVHVSVYSYPQVFITGSDESCAGNTVTLSAWGADAYLWSNGSTESAIQVNPSTTAEYSVVGSNTQCASTATHTITVHALPSAQIQSQNAMCEGSTLALTANGGVAYFWSTGANTQVVNIEQGGTYWVAVQDEFGCVDTARKTIVEYARPDVYIMGASTLCEGSTASLTAYGMGSCHWNTGDTLPTILISQPGTYQVTLTGLHGCTSTSSHDVVQLVTPVVNIVGNTDMCKYDTVVLTANCVNASTFSWSTGATTQMIQVSPMVNTNYIVSAISSDGCVAQASHLLAVHNSYVENYEGEVCVGHPYTQHGFAIPAQQEEGTYTFTQSLQTIYGCDSTRTLVLTVHDVPHIESPITGNSTLYSPGSYVYMIDEVPTATSYEWVISNTQWSLTYNGAVAQLSVPNMGSGYLQVYAMNACGQSTPKSLLIVYGTGVEEFDQSNIKIYPNPTDQWLNIDIDGESLSGEVWIVDMNGKIVSRQNMNGSTKIDVSALAEGTYTLRFDGDGKTFHTKFIKRK